jgi:hypothetical protein
MIRAYILALILVLLCPAFGVADNVHVHGYYRSNGTYVAPYTRGAPRSYSTHATPSLPSAHSHSIAVPWVERDNNGRSFRSLRSDLAE